MRTTRKSTRRPVHATRAFFIKLGDSGCWESECLKNGTLRLGYREVAHGPCQRGDWSKAKKQLRTISSDQGAVTRHLKQLQTFYEADDQTLWITFHAGSLWWCRSRKDITELDDKTKSRGVVDAWSNRDIYGKHLLNGGLSGKLLAVQKYRGTICSVRELSYLLHKINGTSEPHVASAQEATRALQSALIPIIKGLGEQDLETLVDLVFRQAGWWRVGASGGTQRDIDLDLISPVTNERVAVQVKSKASSAVWRKHKKIYADMQGFSRFYFVTHSPDEQLRRDAATGDDGDFVLWDAQQLALMAIRVGLTGWLLDKAS